jgi:hypothetical protein
VCFPGGTVKKSEELYLGWPASGPRFEIVTSRILSIATLTEQFLCCLHISDSCVLGGKHDLLIWRVGAKILNTQPSSADKGY